MTTSNPQVAAQIRLEQECLDEGVRRYREELAQEGIGNLRPGLQLMRAAMEPAAVAIQQFIFDALSGRPGRGTGAALFLDQFDGPMLAWVTGRTILSTVHERRSLTKMAVQVSMLLEESATLAAIAQANPKLAKKMAKMVDKHNDRNRLVYVRKGATFADVKVVQWDEKTRVRVGTTLVTLWCESTGLATIDTLYVGRNRSETCVRLTESATRWLEESHARCELLSPLHLPMVCVPKLWSNPFNGGYLSKHLKKPLVKTRNRGYLTELREWDMPHVYAAVNLLQQTAWSVNTAIFDVLRGAWEHSADLGTAMPKRDHEEMPGKSWSGDDVDPEVLSQWKREAAKVHERNAKTESKRLQLTQKLWVAEKMLGLGNRFHYVYNLDWRGRMYPVATGLNPQGDDVAKALLQFADAVPLGDNGAYWLAVHLANSFGIDKVSFDERVEWVQNNTAMILSIARDPIGLRSLWCDADSPFVFLASCFEWASLHNWTSNGFPQESFPSALPVSFDGSCNGLQNFSAMLRDEVGGEATGLVPSDKPSDVYAAVAKEAQRISDAHGHELSRKWAGKWTRKLAKRNTMTVPYGVSRFGMRDQIAQEFREIEAKGNPDGLDLSFESALYVADCNYEAIGRVVVAARKAMDWLQQAAKVAASNDLPVRWTAPSGFLAVQDYRLEVGEEVDFAVSGRRYRLVIERTGDKLDSRKQARGIAPNFVHSLDASHLVMSVIYAAADGVESFAMVHDSYGCPAGHADALNRNLRQAFVDQYSGDVLVQFRDQLAEQLEAGTSLPVLPQYGSLDLSGVLSSDYFFA